MFLPHVATDIALSEEVSQKVSNSSVLDFSRFAFDRTYAAMNLYKDASFVLAMRGHGQIIPLSFNVPVISLENHHKHRELMEHYGLGEYNVDVTDSSFENNLRDKIYKLLQNDVAIRNHSVKHNDELFLDTVKKLTSIEELNKYVKFEGGVL